MESEDTNDQYWGQAFLLRNMGRQKKDVPLRVSIYSEISFGVNELYVHNIVKMRANSDVASANAKSTPRNIIKNLSITEDEWSTRSSN